MRGRTFKRPSVRRVLNLAEVELPSRVMDWDQYALRLIDSGILVPVGDTYQEAVERREVLEPGQVALYTSTFRIPAADSNEGIKTLDRLMKIDSQPTLRAIAGSDEVPARLTKQFLEKNKIRPYMLLSESTKHQDVENPPWGGYWIGSDGHPRGFTWVRATAGIEMKKMHDDGAFRGRVKDKKAYGKNLRVRVGSRDESHNHYDVDLLNLPMFKSEDPSQYSGWINIEHKSTDPDASFRGGMHDKMEFPGIFWSASTIFAFYEALGFVKKSGNPRKFRINPFPIPRSERDMKFIDDLRLNSLIFAENDEGVLELRVLNKTEIDAQIGARTVLRGYQNIWTHWGNKDFDFLYKEAA